MIFVKQNSINDCGIACSRMLSLHYKKVDLCLSTRFKFENLDKDLNFKEVKELLSENNLVFNWFHIDNDNLSGLFFKTPFLAVVSNELGLKHYVIIKNINEKNVLLADPTCRDFKLMKIQDFKKIFLFDVLIFEKVNKIIKKIIY